MLESLMGRRPPRGAERLCIGFDSATTCKRTGWSASNFPTIPSLKQKCGTLWIYTWIHQDRALILCVDEWLARWNGSPTPKAPADSLGRSEY
jgi:hypothetical protein